MNSIEKYFHISKKNLTNTSIIIFSVIFILNLTQLNVFKYVTLRGNEFTHAELLNQIVLNKTFSIDAFYADHSYFKGKYYSDKLPGFAFFLVPLYYLYTRLSANYFLLETIFLMKYFNAFLSSLTIVCIFLFLSTFKLSKGIIIFGLIACAFGTIFPAYSCLASSQSMSIFLYFFSILFYRFFQIDKNKGWILGMSFFAGVYATIVDYGNWFFLFPLFVVILIDLIRNKKYLLYCLPSLIPIGLLLFYNYKVCDNPFVLSISYFDPPDYLGDHYLENVFSIKNVPRGIYGLLFSPSRGMFLISPITLLGTITLWKHFKERKFSLLFLGLSAFFGIIVLSAYSYWHGGHCIGYRYIIVGAMILGMLSPFFLVKLNKKLKIVAIAILVFSAFTGIMSMFIQFDESLLYLTWKDEPEDIHSNFYSELLYPLLKGRIYQLPNTIEESTNSFLSKLYYREGLLSYEKGLTDKAITYYKESIDAFPEHIEGHINLGLIYYRKGQYKKAIELYNRAIRINLNEPKIYSNLIAAYANEKQYEKAIEVFRNGIKINPNYPELYKNTGLVYSMMKNNEQALVCWKKYLQLYPEAPDAELIRQEIDRLK